VRKIVVAIALVTGLVAGSTPAPAQGPAPPRGRAAWVAFDATFVRTEPGQRKVVGFFHRGTDGSTREESNADGPSRPVILIMNIAGRVQYRLEDDAWHRFPIYLSPNGWRPDSIEHDPRTYRPAPPMEGISVLRFVNPQGQVQFLAPSLNDFPLRTDRTNGGREVFSNIFVRDQPAGLFEPPPGATVHVHSDGASGAIWTPAGP
jgi:hypothetical protein